LIFQLGLFYVCLARRGYQFQYSWNPDAPVLRRAVSLMGYPLGGQIAGTAADAISNNLSSAFGPGMVTALRFATRVIDALAGVLANSIVTVAMPVIMSTVARGESRRALEHLRHSIHLLLLVTMPVSIWLAVANRPLIALLYQRLNFTAAEVGLVSGILVLMIPYIFLSRLLGLAELFFFGAGDTRTPMLVGLAQAGIYVVLTLALLRSLGMHAFPVARVVSYMVASGYLLALVYWRWGSVRLKGLTQSTIRILAASAVMGLTVLVGQRLVAGIPTGGLLGRAIELALPSGLGGIAVIGVLVFLKVVGVRKATRMPFVEVWLPRHWTPSR
jgi:putative peptidoglycan lipid II flippase